MWVLTHDNRCADVDGGHGCFGVSEKDHPFVQGKEMCVDDVLESSTTRGLQASYVRDAYTALVIGSDVLASTCPLLSDPNAALLRRDQIPVWIA